MPSLPCNQLRSRRSVELRWFSHSHLNKWIDLIMLRECTITILILRCHLISLSLMMVKNRPPSWWVIRVPLPHGRGCGTGTCSVAKLSEKRQIRFKMSTFNISTSKELEWHVPGAKTWGKRNAEEVRSGAWPQLWIWTSTSRTSSCFRRGNGSSRGQRWQQRLGAGKC